MSNSLQPYGLQPTRLLYPWRCSWEEYRSGLPCSSPGDLPNPGIEPEFLTCPALAGGFFIINTTWKAHPSLTNSLICFRSLQTLYLSWIFQINGCIIFAGFLHLFFLLSIMFLRFISVVYKYFISFLRLNSTSLCRFVTV